MSASSTTLHRDNPDKEPLIGHVKVTREDWINVARDILISEGVAEVKVLAIGDRLDVSRSSFYWYFNSRRDLLDALLDDWETRNTATLIKQCSAEAKSIGAAACNFFRCFIDPEMFDRGLDFAIREWSRRDGSVRQRIDAADKKRLEVVTAMFERYDYDPYDAEVRARILYYMQLGYHALEVREPMAERMKRMEGYLQGFTGRKPEESDYKDFAAYCLSLEEQ